MYSMFKPFQKYDIVLLISNGGKHRQSNATSKKLSAPEKNESLFGFAIKMFDLPGGVHMSF